MASRRLLVMLVALVNWLRLASNWPRRRSWLLKTVLKRSPKASKSESVTRPKREWAMVPTKLIRPRFSCLSLLRPALSIVRIVEILLIRELTLIAARWRKASTEPKMLLASEQNVRFEIIGRPLHVNPSVVMSLLYCIMGIFKSKMCPCVGFNFDGSYGVEVHPIASSAEHDFRRHKRELCYPIQGNKKCRDLQSYKNKITSACTSIPCL